MFTPMLRLTPGERDCIVKMASAFASDEERVQLLQDIDSIAIELSTASEILGFHIDGYVRPPYRGQAMFKGKDGFPIEGVVEDKDGEETVVLLFADQNHRMLELELVKPSGKPVLEPQWASFRLNWGVE